MRSFTSETPADGATVALNATPAASVASTVAAAPAQPRGAAPTAGPYAQPYATQRPLRQKQQQNTGPLVVGLIIALLVAIIAVGGAAWLVKKAFYPGEPPKTVQVPAVKGHSEAEARKAIETAGLKVGAITYQYNDLAPQGTVLDQGPAMGETVPPGSAVTLIINRGKEQVAVANLVNETIDRAKRKLEQSGLTLGNVTENFSDKVPVGTVIKQEIAPGTKVEKGQPVDLVVSKGPEVLNPVTPPIGTVEPGAEVTEQEPDVAVSEDKSYSSTNPAKRRFVVRVTAQGKQPGQQIEIVKRDDAGGRIVVKSVRMDPGNTQEVPVNATGNVTIEVLQDRKSVFQQRIPAESAGKKGQQ